MAPDSWCWNIANVLKNLWQLWLMTDVVVNCKGMVKETTFWGLLTNTSLIYRKQKMIHLMGVFCQKGCAFRSYLMHKNLVKRPEQIFSFPLWREPPDFFLFWNNDAKRGRWPTMSTVTSYHSIYFWKDKEVSSYWTEETVRYYCNNPMMWWRVR